MDSKVPASLLKRIADDDSMGFGGQKAFHVFVGRLQAIWPDIAAHFSDAAREAKERITADNTPIART